VALHALTDLISPEGRGSWTDAGPAQIAAQVTNNHTVTWERDVNANGVPVRRYVLRGMWQVDPEAPRPEAAMTVKDVRDHLPIRKDDIVRYRDGRDYGRRWTVASLIPTRDVLDNRSISIVALAPDQVVEHQFARPEDLEVVRRAEP